ncbi:hypothetical protein LCM02_08395 [Lutimonas saemankumensis]|uniref:hypothetical protein n=1 Tax=Lutimonas saemankumensis TaxID=483016 RepID=UPI001CD3B854|nr:hypothetical protein [Lutimonas saemankumensis]MCA0932468.1 hypothetical protein [Lutimonas saemankumensis]
MKNKTLPRLSFVVICFLIFLVQSCEETSFGEDLQVRKLPMSIDYPEILNSREFSYIQSAAPFVDANGHAVEFEIVSARRGDQQLDETYMEFVSILNAEIIETPNPIYDGPMYIEDLGSMGTIIIAEGNPFGYGDYYFTIRLTTVNEAGETVTEVFEDAFHLNIAPGLVEGLSYCPFKMNFVSGEGTTSGPAELFGGNPDVRFELATESDKLSIDAVTGALSLNTSYVPVETETLNPIINVVSNVSEEVTSFEGTFAAVASLTPVELEKENDYFFFPKLKLTSKQNAALGGDGYSRVFVEHKTGDVHIKAGDPEETTNWFISKALWRNHKNSPVVDTPDAIEVREEAGVNGTQTLEHQMWTITGPSESWIIMDPQNLALYKGCFDSKAVFWYKIFMNDNSGYEEDGSTPIELEVHITSNYTGDVTTTSWTQVNDILECEINNNGTVFTGTPYPGDQSGIQPPNGVKDPSNSPNDLWVRAELDLDEYRSEEAFTIAFRFKTQYEEEPFYVDPETGEHVLNGSVRLSNVHFVASEK